jgi:methionyl-tRNA formyltransferase
MRVILIGQAAFAEQVLEGLRERGHGVAAVVCPPDSPAGKVDPVKARAGTLGIPVRQHRSLKGAEVRREFADLDADLGVMAYVTQIMPLELIETPRLGSICFHPSLLPRHRGGTAIPWQIINGETRGGVTVFWADAGIDTGPILLQKEATIGPDDSAGSLYYEKLFGLGVATVLESVDLIAAGKAPRIPQDESRATYDPLCRDEHAEIDWGRPVKQVYDLIRGCDPQPGAFATWKGEKLRCYDARRVHRADAVPGRVAEIGPDGVVVGAAGGAIRIGRMRVGDKKVAAGALAEQIGLEVGSRLSSDAR